MDKDDKYMAIIFGMLLAFILAMKIVDAIAK